MEPRHRHILNYMNEHLKNYPYNKVKKALLDNGYTSEEIEEAKIIYENGYIKDSFFQKAKKENKKKTNFPYHIIALLLSMVPIIGFIYAFYASKKINLLSLKGRETAFLSILINFILTLLALLIIIKKI